LPRLDGLAATELLRRREHPPEVIVLTTFHTDHQVLHALRAGASGLLLKDTKPADIVPAIRRVAGGEPMLSPIVTRQLIAHVNNVKGLIAWTTPDTSRHGRCSTGTATVSAKSPSLSAVECRMPRSPLSSTCESPR